ncbi:MAG: hypothetical protein R3F13_13155 [Prosthecobacter sp.]
MTMTINKKLDLPALTSPLCRHTLDDWQRVLQFVQPHAGRLRPKIFLQVMRAAIKGDGLDLPTPKYTDTISRHREYDNRASMVNNWPGLFYIESGLLFVLPDVVAALPRREVLISLERVLSQMVRALTSALKIGMLLHAARGTPIYLSEYNSLVWTRDFKNRTEAADELVALKLLTLTPEFASHHRSAMRVRLTDAGHRLLLGHWGRAVIEPPMVGTAEERRAA